MALLPPGIVKDGLALGDSFPRLVDKLEVILKVFRAGLSKEEAARFGKFIAANGLLQTFDVCQCQGDRDAVEAI